MVYQVIEDWGRDWWLNYGRITNTEHTDFSITRGIDPDSYRTRDAYIEIHYLSLKIFVEGRFRARMSFFNPIVNSVVIFYPEKDYWQSIFYFYKRELRHEQSTNFPLVYRSSYIHSLDATTQICSGGSLRTQRIFLWRRQMDSSRFQLLVWKSL